MSPLALPQFPVNEALAPLAQALARGNKALLQAPPGAGKSTIVPLALLDSPWLGAHKILMLEPRRIAARAVAQRMARLLGQAVGKTVGFRTRLETRVSRGTRIEVITEGILTRMLQSDPELTGIGCVIFDEFHERSLNADLGLALCLESQDTLREDLRLLVMSATLDLQALARLLDGAPVSRLTNIVQGSNSVTLAPDAANRRGTITYPNGVIGTYGFDAANQLLSLAYKSGSNTVGALAYTYDLAGHRITNSGSFSSLTLPTAITQTTYDAANRLTEMNGSAIGYDNNGNLSSNSSGTYTWDVRNQLTATSVGGGSFSYDAIGRRVSATVSGTKTTYVYDGQNPAMIASTQMLAGRGIDEFYSQVTSSGTSSLLVDGNGNVAAESNASAATTADYSYAPYGTTTNTGTSASRLQYASRENDEATGLYYYRARYYSPQQGRFISQDPIGLMGGINTYAYVNGNPISYIDPLGEYCLSATAIGAISGGVGGAVAGALAGGLEGAAAGGVGALPGAVAGLFTGGVLGTASGAIIAVSTGQAAYGGSIASGSTNAGVIGGAVTGIVSYGLTEGGGLNSAAANGIGGAVGGLYEAALSGRLLRVGSAVGAIGGLVSGIVQQALESGNDCGCGK